MCHIMLIPFTQSQAIQVLQEQSLSENEVPFNTDILRILDLNFNSKLILNKIREFCCHKYVFQIIKQLRTW